MPSLRTAVIEAVAGAGVSLPADLDFEVIGTEPVLPSPHHLATGAAAARLLTGVGASEMWRVRTGRPQSLSVDARHAAAALTSFAHVEFLEPDRRPAESERRSWARRITAIVEAQGSRYVQLHGSFNDGPVILSELGLDTSATPEDIAAAVRGREAFELEAAFIRHGVCGGVVRTRQEWAAHPQGQALLGRPVVTVTRIGDGPPRPLPDGGRPASGVRVLDLTRVLAGPTCAKTLAEHGADVLHVTSPRLPTAALFDVETGIGKRQAHVDLTDDSGAELLGDLAASADVFSQGYRRGAIDRHGFGPADLARLRPGIVYVSENCYGPVGPWADRPGWEQLAQAATGMSHREGQSDGVPRLAPAAVNDYSTGYLAAYGAMVALARRATEGGSWHVEASLCQTAMWYQELGDDNDPSRADPGDVDPYREEMDTAHYGRIRYLSPALAMSETPPRWDLPPAPPGTHAAAWS
ncbi:MAG TPA: CoA transferase [Acidimicrobiales bacterium]|nr:CoA transferase [Acidimicrobiales bacterium]